MPVPPEADVVLVQPASLTLQAGADAQLAAQVNDEQGEPVGGASIRFEAEDPQVLKVTATGRVTALGRAVSRTYVRVESGARETRVPVEVRPGSPGRFVPLVELRQSVAAGSGPPRPAAARLLDDWGNPLPDHALSIERSDADAAGERVATDGEGRVSIAWPTLTRSGAVRLVLRPEGAEAPVVEFGVDVRAGPPASLALDRADRQAAGETAAGSPVAVMARVQDAFGNPVGGQPLRIRVAATAESPWIAAETGADGVANVSLASAGETPPARIEAELVGPVPLQAALALEHVGESASRSVRGGGSTRKAGARRAAPQRE
jgi:hypothetical protein